MMSSWVACEVKETDLSVSKRQLKKTETQKRLLAAARSLVGEGNKPSIADAARRAGLSVATAYRYYSDPEQLRSDAALELGLAEGKTDFLAEFETRVEGMTDPIERLLVAQRQMMSFVMRNETAYRHFMAQGHLNIATQPEAKKPIPAGGRRIILIEAALAPIRSAFSAKAWGAYVQALMLVTGPEPYFTLHDYAQLSDAHIFDVTEQAIRDISACHFRRAGLTDPD